MRVLKAAVGVVAVAALLAGCSGGSDDSAGGQGDKKSGSSKGSGDAAKSGDEKVSVQFKVTSNLPLDISMTGTSGSGGHTEEFKHVKAPWNKTVQVDKGRYPSVAVKPVNAANKGEVACEMLVGGKSVDKKSGKGTGASLVVDCSGGT